MDKVPCFPFFRSDGLLLLKRWLRGKECPSQSITMRAHLKERRSLGLPVCGFGLLCAVDDLIGKRIGATCDDEAEAEQV